MQTNSQIDVLTWQRRDVDDCAWAPYGDATVIYHRPSGMTHLLNAPSVYLLSELLIDPCTLDQVVGAFEPDGDNVDLQRFRDEILEILVRLERFGLLKRTAS